MNLIQQLEQEQIAKLATTIPEVLRSGDHARIAAWRKLQAETDTRLRRPDLWERHEGARVGSPSGARRRTGNDET